MKTRIEPTLTERYKKDVEAEWILEHVNNHLASLERKLYTYQETDYPIGFVVGVPRTGTTLLVQILASSLDLGYIDNFAAMFWRAPVIGIKLSEKLKSGMYSSSYTSDFGRTQDLEEPHEFGYFWSEKLNYREPIEKGQQEESTIDWVDLKRVLVNMSGAFKKPAIYKAFYLGWHMERLASLIPKSVFFWIRRPPLETALSLLRMRREFLGSVESWASLKPINYKSMLNAPPIDQTAAQVHALEVSFANQAKRVPDLQRLILHYEDLCSNPGNVIREVRNVMGELGVQPAWKGKIPPPFEIRKPTRNDEMIAMQEALNQWYKNPEIVCPWTELIDLESRS